MGISGTRSYGYVQGGGYLPPPDMGPQGGGYSPPSPDMDLMGVGTHSHPHTWTLRGMGTHSYPHTWTSWGGYSLLPTYGPSGGGYSPQIFYRITFLLTSRCLCILVHPQLNTKDAYELKLHLNHSQSLWIWNLCQ